MENNPLNTLQQLMCITMEECGELTQICSKQMRKYNSVEDIQDDQRTKLLEEAGDVYCMIDLLCEHGILDWQDLEARAAYKREKLSKWSTLIDAPAEEEKFQTILDLSK